MSSIPASAMPRARSHPAEPDPAGQPGLASRALDLALTPAFIALSLTACAVSAVINAFKPRAPGEPSTDEMPL
jgi:hypothetical protein